MELGVFMILTQKKKDELFRVIKWSIQQGLDDHKPGKYVAEIAELNRPGASFVSLYVKDKLRASCGTTKFYRPLVSDIKQNAYNAAFECSFFSRISKRETDNLRISFSVLSVPKSIENCQSKESVMRQLERGRDGLIITKGMNRAAFLPEQWKEYPSPKDFIEALMKKADIEAWEKPIRCEKFTVTVSEKNWNAI